MWNCLGKRHAALFNTSFCSTHFRQTVSSILTASNVLAVLTTSKWPVASGPGANNPHQISCVSHFRVDMLKTGLTVSLPTPSWIIPLCRMWTHHLPDGQDWNPGVPRLPPPHPHIQQITKFWEFFPLKVSKGLESVQMLSFHLILPKPKPLACVNRFPQEIPKAWTLLSEIINLINTFKPMWQGRKDCVSWGDRP